MLRIRAIKKTYIVCETCQAPTYSRWVYFLLNPLVQRVQKIKIGKLVSTDFY